MPCAQPEIELARNNRSIACLFFKNLYTFIDTYIQEFKYFEVSGQVLNLPKSSSFT